MLSIALHVLLAAQIQATVPKTVSSVDDIEIGMSVDLVIAGLTKQGYTLRDMVADTAAHDQTKTT
jgi:hypothetical protein